MAEFYRKLMKEFGCEFWNDSCHVQELTEAVQMGAVGATSNPTLVLAAVENDSKRWKPVLLRLIEEYRGDSPEQLTWRLVESVARTGAELLRPVYEKTEGKRGYFCVQVNPKFHDTPKAMIQQARQLSQIAPNIAIKVPSTGAGIEAMEQLTADGIVVNATVSFTISQVIATAEAIQRGLSKASRTVYPYITLMVGRLDDHLGRISQDPEAMFLRWAGIAVFKKAYSLFRERDFQSRLLVAAYRHSLHFSELIGEGVVQSIPYSWWKQFESLGIHQARTIENPVSSEVLARLQECSDFRLAYDQGALNPSEFAEFGPSVHTLNQFVTGYENLVRASNSELSA